MGGGQEMTRHLREQVPGREAAHALAERAHALGWQVGILDPGTGADWNDILQERAAA